MVHAAFDGSMIGDINFETVGRTFRKEAIQKGILYMNIFPYVIWEMQDQVSGMSVACLPILEEHSLGDRNALYKPTKNCDLACLLM